MSPPRAKIKNDKNILKDATAGDQGARRNIVNATNKVSYVPTIANVKGVRIVTLQNSKI